MQDRNNVSSVENNNALEGLHDCLPKGYPRYCGVITISGRRRSGRSSRKKRYGNKVKKSSIWTRLYVEV